MPLPIPDIMLNASKALEAAALCAENASASHVSDLKDALKKIHPNDLMAVLNEVGSVYKGIHEMQALSIGSRANFDTKSLELVIQVNFGIGPRPLTISLPVDQAEQIVKQLLSDVTQLKPARIIANVGEI